MLTIHQQFCSLLSCCVICCSVVHSSVKDGEMTFWKDGERSYFRYVSETFRFFKLRVRKLSWFQFSGLFPEVFFFPSLTATPPPPPQKASNMYLLGRSHRLSQKCYSILFFASISWHLHEKRRGGLNKIAMRRLFLFIYMCNRWEHNSLCCFCLKILTCHPIALWNMDESSERVDVSDCNWMHNELS